MKKAIGKIHLWLGGICGTVVVVSMLAAAVFVWDEELTQWYYHDYVYVETVGEKTLPSNILLEVARQSSLGKEISGVQVNRDPRRSFIFNTYKVSGQPGFSWMSDMDYYDEIYVDQYSGKYLGTIDKRYDWIFMTRMLHQCLLLHYEVGHLIVGIATLIVTVMLITGMVLWWPKNKAALRQRVTVKWNAKWRRINYDIHNVGGFYSMLIVLLLAVTGLVWTFDWWTNGIYRLLGTDPKEVFAAPPPVRWLAETADDALERVLQDGMSRRANWTTLFCNLPRGTEKSPGEFSIFLRYDDNNGWDESDGYYYHAQTGALHRTRTHDEKLLGEKWRNSNYAIHVGSLYGLPTKIVASLAALFLASLPVTGFYIWIGRNRKTKKGIVQKTIPGGKKLKEGIL